MDGSKPVSTPIVCNTQYDHVQQTRSPDFPYKSALGSLMYLANYTRPDITFAVHFLARYQRNPEPIHYIMVKRVFCFTSMVLEPWV